MLVLRRVLAACVAAAVVSACGTMRGGGTAIPAMGRLNGWSVLPSSAAEPRGYGLYTYVLFGVDPKKASADMLAKEKRVVRQFLVETPLRESYGPSVLPSEINLVLFPVEANSGAPPASDVDKQTEFIIEHYDFPRAATMLRRFPERNTNAGPYLVASLLPLSSPALPRDEHVVFVTLTYTVMNNDSAYVTAFLNQVKKPRFWDEDVAQQLVLSYRNAISLLATKGPPTIEALKDVVDWIRKGPLTAVITK
jgi:predicted small secreted protein